jgi:ATP-dependent RNA helicase DeaD
MSFDSSASESQSAPEVAPEAAAEGLFAQMDLPAPILAAVEKSGYTIATPIQARAIPPLLEGRDVLGQAQTGTGKTAAFALPLLARLDAAQKTPQILVLAPTRELAMQVAESFERYAVGLPNANVAAIYGGSDYVPQLRALERGAQVVVGTPGRVMDLIRRGTLKLDGIRALVLDEADEMLRMGFAEDVEWVLGQLPAERQIALFSATMPGPIRRIAEEHLRDPIRITIDAGGPKTADTVRQRYLVTVPHLKPMVLSRVLEAEPTDGVIVFVKTKSTTENLADYLAGEGHRVAALSSDVAQAQRERIVEHLKNGNLDVIVATDVAARGLDVPRISHVINYDVPFDDESYVHRIGRTGRAGRSGEAIMFLLPRDRGILRRIERATRQTIEPMEVPSKRAINTSRVARFHQRITEALARTDLASFASVIEQFKAKNEVAPEQLSAALVALAVGHRPLFVNDDLKGADFRLPPAMRDDRHGGRHGDRRGNHFAERGERGGPEFRERGPRPRDAGRMETFRIDVGRNHQVMPGNIVGAITGELGVRSSIIGRIEIYDDHSTIDLLEGMPPEMFQALKQVAIGGQRINIRRLGPPTGHDRPKERKPKSGKPRKPKHPTAER